MISVTNISQLRENADISIGLSLRSSKAAQDIDALTIDISDYIKPGREHLVTLDRCNVCQRLKQNSRRFFDEATQAHFENSLQVTVENRVVIIDLTRSNWQPIEDHEAVDQLLDPQLFVEFGV